MKKIDSRICAYWLMHFLRLPIFIFLLLPFVIKAQNTGTANSQSIIVGFYNFENYYDPTNQLNVADEEFLPNSAKQYNSVRFKNKSAQLASVIYGIGKINNANGISLLGIAEVENKMVLKKLADEPMIKKYNYQFADGDILAGKIISFEKYGFILDIGTKILAYLPKSELFFEKKILRLQHEVEEAWCFLITCLHQ